MVTDRAQESRLQEFLSSGLAGIRVVPGYSGDLCSVVAAVRSEGLMVVCGGSGCGVLPTVTFLGVRDVVCLRCGCGDWS